MIESNCYYVDKTRAIEELLKDKNEVSLFMKPRRFGKSLSIPMLDHFFNIDYKSKSLFKDLYISKSEYYKEINKYPVIAFAFKDKDVTVR